ncbi:hypothetical protein [Erysipelothrix anatis]|nr:hypothetical protein [Erysipelothrix anatis]
MLYGYEIPLYELMTFAFYGLIALIIISGLVELANIDVLVPHLPGNF